MPEHFAIHNDVHEQFALVWENITGQWLNDHLFYLKIRANRDGYLYDMIRLDDDSLEPLAYLHNHEEVNVGLNYTEVLTRQEDVSLELYQNQPNPFNGETIIQFFLPKEGEVTIRFYTESGQLIFEHNQSYTKGINALRLQRHDLNHINGLIYYQLNYGDQSLSRKNDYFELII